MTSLPRLAVIDAGGGNLGSLLAALDRHGVTAEVVDTPEGLRRSDAAILPGDGAFGATMSTLHERGLVTEIERLLGRGRPFLGICIGMQILFERSEEEPDARGIGRFAGTVRRFPAASERIPHMGWNTLEEIKQHAITHAITAEEYVYFLHSYHIPIGTATVATTTYGLPFSAMIAEGSLVATQFHPEKSARTGARVLQNFLHLAGLHPTLQSS